MGRRGKYETHIKPHLDEIKDLVRIMNEADIADKFGIAISSWENYKRDHSEFREALLGGREILIEELRDTMKMKARGYYYDETKTKTRITDDGQEITYKETYHKYAQPDTGAIHLLLKNLDKSWRNDDQETMDLKREQLELKKKQAEESEWKGV